MEGGGRPGDPGSKPRVPLEPPEPVALTGSLEAARGAARPHSPSRCEGPAPLAALADANELPGTAAAAAGARPAHGALRRGSAVLIPDRRPARPRSSAPPGRGWRRKATSTRFPGRAARAKSSPNKLRRPAEVLQAPSAQPWAALRGLLPDTGGYGCKPSLPSRPPPPRPRYCKHCSS